MIDTCSTNGREEKCIQNFTFKTQEDLGIDDKMISRSILEEYGVRVCTGFIWLAIRTDGRLL
jgi:hypothetical protein